MFDQLFYQNTVRDWLISVGIILGALIINKLFVLLNKKVIQKLTKFTKSNLDNILFEKLESPFLFGIILTAIWFAAKRLQLGFVFESKILYAYKILIVINITWFAARFINALVEEYLINKVDENNNKLYDSHIVYLFRKLILILIWIIGIVTALNNIGHDISSILGTMAIGGAALALAVQTPIKNLVGGFSVFFNKPFKVGDRVKIESFDGFVEEIGLQTTRLRNLDKRVVTIPNYKMAEVPIENVSQEPMRRVVMKVQLRYSTTHRQMEEAMSILRDIPKQISEVSPDDLSVAFTDFSEYAMIITFVYFIKKEGDVVETPSKVNTEILRSYNLAGLQFALPTQIIENKI